MGDGSNPRDATSTRIEARFAGGNGMVIICKIIGTRDNLPDEMQNCDYMLFSGPRMSHKDFYAMAEHPEMLTTAVAGLDDALSTAAYTIKTMIEGGYWDDEEGESEDV